MMNIQLWGRRQAASRAQLCSLGPGHGEAGLGSQPQLSHQPLPYNRMA